LLLQVAAGVVIVVVAAGVPEVFALELNFL